MDCLYRLVLNFLLDDILGNFGIKAAVKGAKLIPWDQLFKEAEINTNSLNLQTSNTKL